MCKALRLFGLSVFFASVSLASACSGRNSPTAPTATTTLPVGSATITLQRPGQSSSALGDGVTDETLADAGWTCIQPGNGLTLCFPPGLGAPPFLPAVGSPTYTFMAFTSDHEFVHRVTLRRADLYHGEPCLGGAPWEYLGFLHLDYFECINPTGRG
jgi:hypothetical protein